MEVPRLCVRFASYLLKPRTSFLTSPFSSCGSEGLFSELYISLCLVSQLSDHDKGQIILLQTFVICHIPVFPVSWGGRERKVSTLYICFACSCRVSNRLFIYLNKKSKIKYTQIRKHCLINQVNLSLGGNLSCALKCSTIYSNTGG